MILKNTDLGKLASNCIGVTETPDNGIRINRFTPKQWEVYKKYNLPAHPHFNAGVCFDFIYDGKGIWFDFMPMMKASRRYISFDVYENDRFVYTFTNFNGTAGIRRFSYEFAEKKERRVRIFLPYTCALEIWNFTLDDGSNFSPTPTEGKMKILMYGDSITHGYDSQFTSTSYAGMVATHYSNAIVLNQAVGGFIFCADSLDEELDYEPDVITVAYGTNDWSRYGLDEEKYRSMAKAYIDKLCKLYPNAKIFGILPLWRDAWNKFEGQRMPFAKIYDILTEYYTEYGITIIDGRDAVPSDNHFFADGVHPNTAAHALYGKHVICCLEKAGIHN